MTTEESGRDRILHVARELFIDRGFSDVSMQQIADAAGLRKASIYHHFPSKVELFVAVTWLEIDDVHAQTEAAIAAATEFIPQLHAIAKVWFASIRGDRGRLMREFQEHVPAPEQYQFEQRFEQFVTTITGAFEQAAAAGQLGAVDPKTAAAIFFDIVCGWVYRAYLDPTLAAADPDHAIQTITDVLLFGIASPALTKLRCPLQESPPAAPRDAKAWAAI
ncbi:MAG: TetR/AcrR family transcriptional regulator [Chloroflexota bacterium]|nr:TetR/AcrR family transcriptional regulator [Chloroflexota bacterium]